MAISCRLQRFCCCCTVRTGSLIIGTLGWILTLVKLFGFINPSNSTQPDRPRTEQEQKLDEIMKSVGSNSLGARIGYAVIALIVCVLLIWGIYKKDRRFMLPYIIVQCIESILVSIITVIVFVCIFIVPADIRVVAIIGFVLLVPCTLLYWYFWLCVWSHYKELDEGGQHPAIYYSPTSAAPPPTEKDRQEMI